jgi:tRNA splicing endonuclease
MVLLIDDLILGPGRFMSWIFRQIDQMAEEELQGQAEHIKQELAELYDQFEKGAINDEEFDTREHALLDRMESMKAKDSDQAKTGDQTGRTNERQ